MGTQNYENIVQNFPPHWIIGFLEVYEHLIYCLIVLPFFFSSVWRMQKIWSVVDPLRRNSHWWSPIISSMYGTNFERRIFDKILYEVDSLDIPR
jgi:hypothetical protein